MIIVSKRLLITDNSPNSQEAFKILKKKNIDFIEIPIKTISSSNFKAPTLLAPEGRFEGIDFVKAYTKAEENGFHKRLETSTTT